MKICGLNKTTLLDYPGKVAASIFLGGCNLRCPFCHNAPLVLHAEKEPELDQEEILHFLKKRRGILEGVCVSGGEPTLASDLPEFLAEIKALGYPIKLDTNGSHPDLLKDLSRHKLIDKIAMDIKASPSKYPLLTGLANPDLASVNESISFLLEGHLDYEFRTTVVKELHTAEDFLIIREWIAGAKEYYLQAYRDSDSVIQKGFSSYPLETLMEFKALLSQRIPVVEIRGID